MVREEQFAVSYVRIEPCFGAKDDVCVIFGNMVAKKGEFVTQTLKISHEAGESTLWDLVGMVGRVGAPGPVWVWVFSSGWGGKVPGLKVLGGAVIFGKVK